MLRDCLNKCCFNRFSIGTYFCKIEKKAKIEAKKESLTHYLKHLRLNFKNSAL